jgi:hypothetical protein
LPATAEGITPFFARETAGEGTGHREFFSSLLSLRVSQVEGYRFLYLLTGEADGPERVPVLDPWCSQGESLSLYLLSPDGLPVEGARVVFTLIGADGRHRMFLGSSIRQGYRLELGGEDRGRLRVEIEAIIPGELLTDQMSLELPPETGARGGKA